ncbi:uncharacterized protein EDB93DRAFT_1118000, partial [Suillus bovinus]|uniref:uncharacterized protein n=1 Tax=Suillus bovinus TaxID=48563 RepID=UPI001B86DDBE
MYPFEELPELTYKSQKMHFSFATVLAVIATLVASSSAIPSTSEAAGCPASCEVDAQCQDRHCALKKCSVLGFCTV